MNASQQIEAAILPECNPFLYTTDPHIKASFDSIFSGIDCLLSQDFTLSSSSTLHSNSKNYSPAHILDHDVQTAWVEGVSGDGIGEYLQLNFNNPSPNDVITGFFVSNGYTKTKKTWRENNRIKTLKLSIDDTDYYYIHFKDSPCLQLIDLPTFIPLSSNENIKLTIVSVYEGSKYEDTCISEISVLGVFGNPFIYPIDSIS